MTMQAKVSIENIYQLEGIGVLVIGTVIEGTLKKGMEGNVNGRVMHINNIETDYKSVDLAEKGKRIGFTVSGVDKRDIRGGMTIILSDSTESNIIYSVPEKKKSIVRKFFER
jgi:GTPase